MAKRPGGISKLDLVLPVQLFARFNVFVFQQRRILRCVRVCLGKILQAPRMIALVEVVQNQLNL